MTVYNFFALGGFYSVPTNVQLTWNAPLGPAVTMEEPVGAIVLRYDVIWKDTVTRSYPGGTTVLYCEVCDISMILHCLYLQ